jgi:tetratricopeptide (TPR) repeat protein
MKRILILTAFGAMALFWGTFAQSPDENYVQAYNLIQQADQQLAGGEGALARGRLLEAQAILKKLHASHPQWNDKVIQFRLRYVEEKLAALEKQLGPMPQPQVGVPSPGTTLTPARSTPPAEYEGQIRALMQEVQKLQADRTVLENKLREALSVQPAVIDARELQKAEERIKALEKERDLLKANVEIEQSRKAKTVDPEQFEKTRKALADAKDKLEKNEAALQALQKEKNALDKRLQAAQAEADQIKTLRAENDNLKKQIAEAGRSRSSSTPGAMDAELAAAKATMQKQELTIASLKDELKKLNEQQGRQAKESAPSKTAIASNGHTDQIKKLEKERDDLARKVAELTTEAQKSRSRGENIQLEYLTNQVSILRARLEILEARKVPYTPEELALLKGSEVSVAKVDPKAARKNIREIPSAARPFITEAERAFAARRFEEAEQKYSEALKHDEKNLLLLSNLAAAQLEQSKLAEAEATLQKALALDSQDGPSLSLLGIIRFRQEKFDEALEILSRAASIDPQNAETHNYLGITLGQKGHRAAAETALRRAIQLMPGHASAHHNLAVIYASQNPPSIELARWHYQKAIAAGHAANPQLEKALEGKKLTSDVRTE